MSREVTAAQGCCLDWSHPVLVSCANQSASSQERSVRERGRAGWCALAILVREGSGWLAEPGSNDLNARGMRGAEGGRGSEQAKERVCLATAADWLGTWIAAAYSKKKGNRGE